MYVQPYHYLLPVNVFIELPHLKMYFKVLSDKKKFNI